MYYDSFNCTAHLKMSFLMCGRKQEILKLTYNLQNSAFWHKIIDYVFVLFCKKHHSKRLHINSILLSIILKFSDGLNVLETFFCLNKTFSSSD